MKVCIAPDSFKESLSASEVAEAIRRGVLKVAPGAQTVIVPMADGGEGTVRALVDATGGEFVRETVTGPLGGKVQADYGLLGEGETAVIEMAAASGLPLLPPDERNPMLTTTFGTGELIRSALDRGVKHIIVGIGGSATVDGGAGMAQALGAKLLDEKGEEIGFGGGELRRLERIDLSGLAARVASVEVEVACDVTNPLTGPEGAARIYGPQKGATPEMVEALERNLAHLAHVIANDLGKDVCDLPGAGAAGGLGAGLVAFLGAKLRPGVEIVIEASGLREKMKGCHLVITGEGRLDEQSAFGKTIDGVAGVAKGLGIPVVAIAGSLGKGCEKVLGRGVSAYFSTVPGPGSLQEALTEAAEFLERTAEQVMRLAQVKLHD